MMEFRIERSGHVSKSCVVPAQNDSGYWYIELGGGGFNRARRIWINSKAIIKKSGSNGKASYGIMDKLEYRRTEKGNIVLFPGSRNIVLIFATCGYRGESEVEIIPAPGKKGERIIASNTYYHSQRGSLGVSEHVLAELRQGDRVRVRRTGRLYGAESELLFEYQGTELVAVPEDEELEVLL